MFAILIVDAIYLYSDRSTKVMANSDTLGDGSGKNYTPQQMFVEKEAKPSSPGIA